MALLTGNPCGLVGSDNLVCGALPCGARTFATSAAGREFGASCCTYQPQNGITFSKDRHAKLPVLIQLSI